MLRPAVRKMQSYTPGEQPSAGERLIKLNTNENPYPPSPAVRRAITRAAGGSALRLYPEPTASEFVEAAADLYGFPKGMIMAGNGSDELLAILFRAVLGRGDTVAYGVPTYTLYDTLAAVQEARIRAFPLGPDFILPLAEMGRARARMTIVCNPNSPSGTVTSPDRLEDLARRLDGRMLVIDEAYVDFAEGDALFLARRHQNVVVLRSLSKSYSLAGMRLGLAFADPAVIVQLLKIKDSYNLSRVATAAGAQALNDAAWMRCNVERIRTTRHKTEIRLRRLGFEVPPSSANFVLARRPGVDLGPLARALRRRGILVRHFGTPSLRDALRISIGKPRDMTALFRALEDLVPRPAGKSLAAQSRTDTSRHEPSRTPV